MKYRPGRKDNACCFGARTQSKDGFPLDTSWIKELGRQMSFPTSEAVDSRSAA